MKIWKIRKLEQGNDFSFYEFVTFEWYFSGSDANPNEIYVFDAFVSAEDVEVFINESLLHLTEGVDYNLHLYARDENNRTSLENIVSFTNKYSPRNIYFSFNNGEVSLSWDEVNGEESYSIYSSENVELPLSSWTEEQTNITVNYWSESQSTDKKFYYIKSTSEFQTIDVRR